jgi:UDP-N-acetylglucosamine--N-acetylmuramyl-(pentapeptide) pyrophosphoryl-undecaprenol N-acetylglucosamine transferase
VAGFTNRKLAPLATRVLAAFPNCFAAGVNVETVGNPVRADIAGLPPPSQRFAARGGAIRLLIIGGSQGATRLNTTVPAAIAKLGIGLPLDVWHQSGERWLAQARASYKAQNIHARVEAFINDMAAAYAWADLVICRSGALTVSELAAVGVGSVLIPFAAATDDHQTHNASWLVRDGAGVSIAESELSADRLAQELRDLCHGRGKLIAMAERARALARPKATEALADACEQVLKAAA